MNKMPAIVLLVTAIWSASVSTMGVAAFGTSAARSAPVTGWGLD